MPRTVTIRSLSEAFAVIKEMQGQDCEWGEDYRAAGRAALAEILARQVALRVDRHLEEMARRGQADQTPMVEEVPPGDVGRSCRAASPIGPLRPVRSVQGRHPVHDKGAGRRRMRCRCHGIPA